MTKGRFLTPFGVKALCILAGLVVVLAFTAALAFDVWP